jgi:hypothetical protein
MPKTKKQEAEEKAKAALRQRVADIITGAVGYDPDLQDADWRPRPSELRDIILSLEARFDPERKKDWLLTVDSLDEFDILHDDDPSVVDKVMDYLFRNGIRA